MCGSVDMSYACLSVCLSVSVCLSMVFFSRIFFAHFNSIERRRCKEMRGPAKCATHLCLVCVWETCVCIGCKLKRSSSHTKTTTRTSALMLHLPCLFTASCPFVGHTHTYMDHIHMCENGFYFNPFFSPLLVFVPLIVCFVLRIHQHWLLLIAVPFSLFCSFSLFHTLCSCCPFLMSFVFLSCF